jgi:hypothetical protein
VTETYVCPNCGATEERKYRVRLIILTCAECGENGRFLHQSLANLLATIPEPDRPDGWGTLPADQRLREAVKEGLVDVEDVKYF